MTARTVKILAVAVLVLFAVVFALNNGRNGSAQNELLFPGLKDRMNELSTVTISDADSEITIERDNDGWIVPDKGGYPANTDTLRQVLLAIAEARKIEQKTSNPELYERLGVETLSEDGSTGVLVSGATGDADGAGEPAFSLILGDEVQQEYRYVRIPDESASWLVDRNPDVPDSVGGWLSVEIVDIDSSRIQSVAISHDDGETIRIHKESEDDTNFTVEDIPEGRELSYPSIGNSIGSGLDSLTLEDVRPADASGDNGGTTTVFTTFDGLQVTVESTEEDDGPWITLAASVVDGAEAPDDAEAPEEADAADDGSEAAAPANEESAAAEDASDGPAEEGPASPAEEAAAINQSVSGWSYRIADYKADQFTRRWDDLLKAPEDDAAAE